MQTPISQLRLIAMVLTGNILETYDYMLYGYFAAILAHKFFPTFDPASSLLLTFTVFSLGFITRPLGAAIFGNFGDKYGRKTNLLISIMLMAIPTTLIGLLPTYTEIGLAAGLLLTLCRLLQGIAVGAEFAGTMVYMIELAPVEKRSLYGSLCICSGYIAMLFSASIVALLTYIIPPDALETWGWRIPFLLGMLLGLVGLYIRLKIPESPAFKLLVKNNTIVASPLLETIKKMPWVLVKGIGIVILHASGFYLLFVYLTSYLSTYHQVSTSTIAITNTIALATAVITLPLFGLLAEKIKKKNLVILSSVSIIFLSYPLFCLINEATFFSILIALTILTILLCLTSAVVPVILSELFPVSLRYSGMALSYNIGSVLLGGTAPLILTYLVDKTQNLAAPGFYLMCTAFVTLVAILCISLPQGSEVVHSREALEER